MANQVARKLRKTETIAEKRLWQELRKLRAGISIPQAASDRRIHRRLRMFSAAIEFEPGEIGGTGEIRANWNGKSCRQSRATAMAR
jgi:hypothetical protein